MYWSARLRTGRTPEPYYVDFSHLSSQVKYEMPSGCAAAWRRMTNELARSH
ncbi:MAG: hypothetical protein QOE61_2906 [Micromonosporaceae bacterium]|jgi:hypothetical protein|nr:hypothetical protein [Micromonosporaceae bacterium]